MTTNKTETEDPGVAAKARSMKEFEERTQGKPTPTQEENDRAALGEHVVEHEPDGSPEQPAQQLPPGQPTQHRSEERHLGAKDPKDPPGSGSGYGTRAMHPSAAPTRPTTKQD